MKNYYEILEVNKKASKEIISKVYKIQVKKYHPDLQTQNNKTQAEERIKEINEAYEILSDDEKRKKYDSTIKEQENDYAYDIINHYKQENDQLKTKINNLINENKILKEKNIEKINYQKDFYRNTNVQNPYVNYNLNKKVYKKNTYKIVIKEKLKSLLALLITVAIVTIIITIIYSVPEWKNYILSELLMIK